MPCTSQMRRLRLGEVTLAAGGGRAGGWQRQGLCLVFVSTFPQIQNGTASPAHSLPSAPLHSHPCFADFAPESPSLNFSVTPLGSWWERLVPTAASCPLAMAQQALPRDVVVFHSCWQTSAAPLSPRPKCPVAQSPWKLARIALPRSPVTVGRGWPSRQERDGRVSCCPELPWG